MLQRTPKSVNAPSVTGYITGSDHGEATVFVKNCPFCGQSHRHGWPDDPDDQEIRGAHCWQGTYCISLDPLSPSIDEVDDLDLDEMLLESVHDGEISDGATDDPYHLATLYLSTRPNIIHHRGEFFEWTDPAYIALDDEQIKKELMALIQAELDAEAERSVAHWLHNVSADYEHLEDLKKALEAEAKEERERGQKKINQTLMTNILGCLRSLCHQEKSRDEFWIETGEYDPPKPLFLAKNCITFRTNAGRIVGVPPTPQFFSVNALDYEFDPEADCPAWMKFLDELFDIKSDTAQSVQEMAGYFLTDDTSQQKIFAFIGPKRSGKGTFARTLGGMVGVHNVCNPTLGSLQGQFGMEPLYGKRLAIVGDARLDGRSNAAVITERLLSISGEDPQTIDRKYKAPVTCQLKTRFLLLSNELPKLADASATLPSRIIMIPFSKSFYGKEDPELTDKLLAERPGILNWALAGLQRLKERGRFIQPGAGQEMITEMEELSSPALAFVNEFCNTGPGYNSPVADVFNAWKYWCSSRGRKPGTQQVLGRDLRAAVAGLKVTQPRDGESRARRYEGMEVHLDVWCKVEQWMGEQKKNKEQKST